ncbi:ankyrin repeat domain-containing protein [Rheinheimera sp. F8]|uniref:ankyrin repeat domain-containing protein n=1 Tax=Rheinheimera sp. F8 TaxID=1763998 RepID=UPI000A794D35|nr:ankyrin repeat domain-containing protein [Rheinheimera sp. F8]
MKTKRQLIAALFVLMFADVAADPLQPPTQMAPAKAAEQRVTEQQEATLAELSRYFFAAARSGETAVLKEFLQAGVPVDMPNDGSYTALMIAAYQGQASAVDLLLKAGADACIRDKRGHTALMGAMIKAEWGIARQLYAIDCDQANTAKATDAITDKSQMTAAQFAEKFGQSEKFKALATQLQSAEAKHASSSGAGQP